MSSLVITVKAGRSDITNVVDSSSADQEGLQKLCNFLEAAKTGCEPCSIDVQTSSVDPVAASGTITCATVAADATVTIGAVTLTAKASPSGENEFSQAGSDSADATALAAKINAHSVLSKIVSAAAVDAIVTVTCLAKGLVGNQIPLSETGSTITVSAPFLAGGTGGATTSAATYKCGIA
jgi:hypothetical protein